MTHYLIEFRFFGKAKGEAKSLIWEINKKFRIRPPHRPVPHVSLAGPFNTRNQRNLVSDFKGLCKKHGVMGFKVVGYNTFEDNRVVYIDINPSDQLDKFRWELARAIKPYCYLKSYDLERKFHFHATIAMKLSPSKFKAVKKYISKKPKPNYKHILLRAAIIKNSKILYEYDFMLKRLFNRNEAKSRAILTQTFDRLKKYFDGGKNNVSDRHIQPIIPTEEIDIDDIKEGFISKILNRFRERKIFFISDNHFDHTNIIKYCKRPFKSANEMNESMLDKWNSTVKKNDIVFFLGDMAFGRGSKSTDHWLSKLNGNIYFIKGNHESISRKTNVFDKLIITYKGKKFFLVHDPEDAPKDWKGWIIHGHHHNNKPEFPIIHKENKTINVSVEVIDYKPVLLEDLLKLME